MKSDDEERNPLDDIIDSTNHSKEWLEGFEVGILYVLMSLESPYITGVCERNNEEIIFALARKCGYTWDWNPIQGNKQSNVSFVHKDAESDE